MPKYTVGIKETHFNLIDVEADTAEEAEEKAEELQVTAFCDDNYGFSHESEIEVNVGEVTPLSTEQTG